MHEIKMFAVIGEQVKANEIKQALAVAAEDGEELLVRIDSEGGVVFDGFSIYSAFQAFEGKKSCIIESAAFSIASYIAMAFDHVAITRNGYLMIHNPYTQVAGDEQDMRQSAELLAKLKTSMVEAYAQKSNIPAERIQKMMDEETFLNAEEALAAGFVDEIVDYAAPSRVVESHSRDTLPYRAVASLIGPKTPDPEPTEQPTEEEPVAQLTPKQIRERHPKASSDFIVKAMDEEMSMEDVDAAMVAELLEENEALKAKLSAMEEEQEAKAKAEEEEEEEEQKVAARSGVAPVANVSQSTPDSATVRWKSGVAKLVASGLSRQKALSAMNRQNPGLREQMLEEQAA